MPAAARYIAIGEPKPPAPMHRTLVALIFFWPARPTSGKIKMPGVATDFFVVQLHNSSWIKYGKNQRMQAAPFLWIIPGRSARTGVDRTSLRWIWAGFMRHFTSHESGAKTFAWKAAA